MANTRHLWAGLVGVFAVASLGAAGCASGAPSDDSEAAFGTTEEAVTGAVGDWTGFTDGQCVHGVYQFYANRYGIDLLGTCAQAGDLGICENCGACMIWESSKINPPPSLFNKYDFGTTMPQTYDIVVYPPRGGVRGPGHVACVDHIDSASASDWQHMYVMDTNWAGNEKMATAVHTVTRAPYGIFRLKSLDHKPPTGQLDVADCTSIGGWAQDPEKKTTAIAADLSFEAPAGDAKAVEIRVPAGTDRADLCTPLGSCNHAYSFPTPRGAMDNAEHAVYAYGVGTSGNEALLANAPKKITCAPPAIPAGAKKRYIGDPTILEAWSFQTYFDMATYPQGEIDALPADLDVPAAPSLVKVDGSADIYVVDGTERRAVTDMTAFAAWRFDTTKVKTIAAAELAGYTEGLAWPAAPLLVKSTDDVKVYLLDGVLPPANDDAGAPGGSGQAPGAGVASDGAGSNADSGSSGGCSVGHGAGAGSGLGWLVLPALGLVVVRRRRARSA